MIGQLTRIALTAAALIGFAGSAQAALVADLTINDCDADGCDGSTLYLAVDDDGDSGNWIITYTVNADGYSNTMDGINQAGGKWIKGWDPLLSSVTGPTDSGTWMLSEGPINSSVSSPCNPDFGDNSDMACAMGFVDITGDGEYTWTFYLVGGTLLPTADWHLGGQYADGGGRATGQIWSTDGAVPVPEPTAAVLFGLGAILVARRTQRS